MAERIKWKKIGGGTFRLASGKIIKPNQEFMATSDQIPGAFRDVIKPLDSAPEALPDEVPPDVQQYEIVHRSHGWYDITDNQGKKINEKSLRKKAAENMIEILDA